MNISMICDMAIGYETPRPASDYNISLWYKSQHLIYSAHYPPGEVTIYRQFVRTYCTQALL